MNHTLWNALVVKMRDYLAGVKILQQRGAPDTGGERVIGVVDANALLGSEITRGSVHPGRVELLLFGIRRAVHDVLLSGAGKTAAGYPGSRTTNIGRGPP